MNTSYLLDKEFLAKLDKQQSREIFARIIALDINENPIESIEGRVTGGSINIDGNSAVRRTCNLSMVCQDINITDFYWGIRSKFKLEIGLLNTLDSRYPDIVWFPQGVFLIATFNTSISTNNCSISISGKDKMCMLNGDMGGNLPASIDFGTEELLDYTYEKHDFNSSYEYTTNTYWIKSGQYKLFTGSFDTKHFDYSREYYKLQDGEFIPIDISNGVTPGERIYIEEYKLSDSPFSSSETYYDQIINKTIIEIPIYKIIREGVHTWANEPYHNIIINDLETFGLEQMQYKGDEDTPLYAFRNIQNDAYTQMTLKGSKLFYKVTNKILNDDGTIDDAYVDWQHGYPLSNFLTDTSLKAEAPTDGYAAVDRDELTWICFPTTQGQLATPYTVLVLQYGDDAGYRITDLTYAGDLISAIGDTFTSVLDKIKTMLGDFEYFYNLDGQFVFQRKRTYINCSWNSIHDIEDDTYIEPAALASPTTYDFIGNQLLTAFNNTPALNNVKNDYSVWGVRKGISGAEIPIHTRYAIDKKPCYYKSFDGTIYATSYEEFEDISYKVLKQEIYRELQNQLFEFNLSYMDGVPTYFKRPIRNPDGSWTPGWWDIRDWCEYYKILTGTDPIYTMKWYSQGDESGTQKTADLFPQAYSSYRPRSDEECCWLVVLSDEGNGRFAFEPGHGGGFGTEYNEYGGTCYLYEQPFGTSSATQVTSAEGIEVQKYFVSPYYGCSDSHTYEYFRIQIRPGKNDHILFYNPAFPSATFESLVEEKITKPFKEAQYNNEVTFVNWREIIYQMALDYFKYNDSDIIDTETGLPIKDIFLQKIAKNNEYLYPTGYTGYEQYYTDLQGFWRQLYNPQYEPKYTWERGEYQNTTVVVNAVTGYNYAKMEWKDAKITDAVAEYYLPYTYVDSAFIGTTRLDKTMAQKINDTLALGKPATSDIAGTLKYNKAVTNIVEACVSDTDDRKYWNRAVFEAPETLNFWFDFLDSESELAQFSVRNIGDRSKVVNDTKVTSIYFKQVPEFIFSEKFSKEEFEDKPGYTFLYLPSGLEKLFSISYRGKSAKDETDSLLYQFSYCAENVTITSLPVYYLEPNTRIFVSDDNSKIYGEYIVTRITVPLTYNGTMQITANKAPVRLY